MKFFFCAPRAAALKKDCPQSAHGIPVEGYAPHHEDCSE